MKIFNIGLNKTGTNSLHYALEHLGYASVHGKHDGRRINQIIDLNLEMKKPILQGIDQYDAFTDFGGFKYFKKLDLAYPNSKFIFTERDEESWLKSREKHVLRNLNNKDYKGNWTKFDKESNRQFRLNIIKKVTEYFRNRETDVLYMNIIDGDGWDILCPFLQHEIPQIPFPKANVKNKSKGLTKDL